MSRRPITETHPAIPDTLAPLNPTPVAIQPPLDPVAQEWQTLLTDADQVDGHALEKDKDNLIGLPFIITGITFREGIVDRADKSRRMNYVSVEAMLPDTLTLRHAVQRGRITPQQAAMFAPGERIVFNDGSAGICRQLAQYAHTRGYVACPDGPETGDAGATRYDTPHLTWDIPDGSPAERRFATDDSGITAIAVKLACLRGLRVSTYDAGYGEDSATYYLG